MDARPRHRASRQETARRRLRLLGIIIAGGSSRRFGSDKALAILDGRALIEHVAEGLKPQAEALAIAGRAYPGFDSLIDLPAPGMGPLGGLCGALVHAEAGGFDAILTAPCDTLPVPPLASLPEEGAVLENWPLFGRWPVRFAQPLARHLALQTDRSMRGWIAASGIAHVPPPSGLVNCNTPEALASYPCAPK